MNQLSSDRAYCMILDTGHAVGHAVVWDMPCSPHVLLMLYIVGIGKWGVGASECPPPPLFF